LSFGNSEIGLAFPKSGRVSFRHSSLVDSAAAPISSLDSGAVLIHGEMPHLLLADVNTTKLQPIDLFVFTV
jgi:hypothetical protein